MVFHKAVLVDDDKTNQYLTYLVLQELQLAEQTVLFADGKLALDYVLQHMDSRIAKGCPDLILLDINMPIMNGFEFLEQLTQMGHTALIQQSVVVLTTSENGQDHLEARHWQVKDYLVKPLTVEKMTEFMQRHYSLRGKGC